MRGFLGSLLGLIGLGDEEFTYGTGLLDPSDHTKLLNPEWLRHATAEQLNAITQDMLSAMVKEQVDAYKEGVANAQTVYNQAVADYTEMQRKANLTFPTSMTQAEVDALSPEARDDYYDRVANAPRPVQYNVVASEGRDGAPDWQYDVHFMNGAGHACWVGSNSLAQVRHYQSTLGMVGIASISRFLPKQIGMSGLGKVIARRLPARTLYRYGPRTLTNMRIITDRPGYDPRSAIQNHGRYRLVRFF